MPGRPRKVIEISTGKISKKEKLNRKIQEEKLKVSRSELETGAPTWLSEEAAAEYSRVVSEAKAINLFDNLDLAILAIYSDCYARYIKASHLAQEHGLTAHSRGAFTVSPYVEVMEKAATQILKCSTKLGLSVTDRLKLIVPTKEEKRINKFLEHLT